MTDPLALLLKNQGLSEPLPDPDAALERLVAVQTQYAQSLEIALAARSKRKVKGWEARALSEGGHLHKCWGLRHTLHAHGPQGWALVHGAVGETMYARHHRRMRAYPAFDGRGIEARILELLREGPKSREEMHALIPGLAELPGAGWGRDVAGAAYLGALKVVGRGAEQRFALAPGPLLSLRREAGRGSDSGRPEKAGVGGGERPFRNSLPPSTWGAPLVDPGRNDLASLPSSAPSSLASERGGGFAALLRAYLRGYGPATVKDFAYWTGFPQRDVAPVFTALREELEAVEGGFVLAGRPTDAPAPPRATLLAKFDPLTLGHADKTRWLAPADYKRVFRIAAQVEAVVLLRGRAAATWRLARKADRATVAVEPFRPLRPPERAAIERATAKMGASIGWGEVEVGYV